MREFHEEEEVIVASFFHKVSSSQIGKDFRHVFLIYGLTF